MTRLDERLRRLEAWVPELGNRRAEDMSDAELEQILADHLGVTPERIRAMSDAELTDFERIVVALEEEKREPTEAEDLQLAALAVIAGPDREVRQ